MYLVGLYIYILQDDTRSIQCQKKSFFIVRIITIPISAIAARNEILEMLKHMQAAVTTEGLKGSE